MGDIEYIIRRNKQTDKTNKNLLERINTLECCYNELVGGSDVGIYKQATVVLQPSDILLQNQKTIIDTPADGKYIQVVDAYAFLDWKSVIYSGGSAELDLLYTDGITLSPVIFSIDTIAVSTDTRWRFTPQKGNAPFPEGSKLISITVGSLTMGNSPITLHVIYRIVDEPSTL